MHRIPLARGIPEQWHAIVFFPIVFAVLFVVSYLSYVILERGSNRLGRMLWSSSGERTVANHAAP